MKKVFVLLSLIGVFLLISCVGPQSPKGSLDETGLTGEAGPQGLSGLETQFDKLFNIFLSWGNIKWNGISWVTNSPVANASFALVPVQNEFKELFPQKYIPQYCYFDNERTELQCYNPMFMYKLVPRSDNSFNSIYGEIKREISQKDKYLVDLLKSTSWGNIKWNGISWVTNSPVANASFALVPVQNEFKELFPQKYIPQYCYFDNERTELQCYNPMFMYKLVPRK